MYKRKKKSNHQDDINKFKKVKQLVQRNMRQAYWNYIEEVISESESESERYLFDPHKKLIQSNNEKQLGSGDPY